MAIETKDSTNTLRQKFRDTKILANFAISLLVLILFVGGTYELLNVGFNENIKDEQISTLRSINIYLVSIFTLLFFIWVFITSTNKAYFLPSKKITSYDSHEIKTMTSPSMSVIWFFIPIFNIFKPYISIKEIWFASNKSMYNDPAKSWWFIKFWWALFLINFLLGRIYIFECVFRDEASKMQEIAINQNMTNALLFVPFCIITIYLLHKITYTQSESVKRRRRN